MRLLADSDAFCKLAAAGLLDDTAKLLGVAPADIERLPALPYMLRSHKKLRNQLGDSIADALIPVAEARPVVPNAPDDMVAKLKDIESIDPGEVQLLALAASGQFVLVTGDKRALGAVAKVVALVPLLQGKVICLEAVLLALCKKLGSQFVTSAVAQVAHIDKVFQICFSGSEPTACLHSYLDDLQNKVSPLQLWQPTGGD